MNILIDDIFNVEIKKKKIFRSWKNLFLVKKYELTMYFIEHDITDKRIVSLEQFNKVNIGDIIELTMFTKGNDMWFYTKKDAEISK